MSTQLLTKENQIPDPTADGWYTLVFQLRATCNFKYINCNFTSLFSPVVFFHWWFTNVWSQVGASISITIRIYIDAGASSCQMCFNSTHEWLARINFTVAPDLLETSHSNSCFGGIASVFQKGVWVTDLSEGFCRQEHIGWANSVSIAVKKYLSSIAVIRIHKCNINVCWCFPQSCEAIVSQCITMYHNILQCITMYHNASHLGYPWFGCIHPWPDSIWKHLNASNIF